MYIVIYTYIYMAIYTDISPLLHRHIASKHNLLLREIGS